MPARQHFGCLVYWCSNKHHGHGYCQKHAGRIRAFGPQSVISREKECANCKSRFQDAYTHKSLCNSCRYVSCEICGQVFTVLPSKVDQQYCSWECSYERLKKEYTCQVCGDKYWRYDEERQGLMACSYECAREYLTINCEWCDGEFVRSRYAIQKKYCSDECRTAAIKEQQISCQHKRRSVVETGNVDRQAVFEQDDWVCQLCGNKINRNLEWPKPMSPSIDHIQPLSKGGTHTKDNVQAAHLRCNVQKNDSTT